MSYFLISEHSFVVVRKLRMSKRCTVQTDDGCRFDRNETERNRGHDLSSTPLLPPHLSPFLFSFLHLSLASTVPRIDCPSHRLTSHSRHTSPCPSLPFPSVHEFRKSLLFLSLHSTHAPASLWPLLLVSPTSS